MASSFCACVMFGLFSIFFTNDSGVGGGLLTDCGLQPESAPSAQANMGIASRREVIMFSLLVGQRHNAGNVDVAIPVEPSPVHRFGMPVAMGHVAGQHMAV